MRIGVTSVPVDDQGRALDFSTNVLGFVKKHDFPVGEAEWLTVVSPDDPDGVELLLEPDGNPSVRIDDRPAEPSTTSGVTTAVFDDTCGNFVMISAV